MNDNIQEGSCVCSVCKEEKDNSHFSFYQDRITKRGEKAGYRLRVNTNCRECTSKNNKVVQRLKKIHLSSKPSPNSPCPCCHRITLKFEIDHDHKTEEFRGWICKDCNVGLGKLGDSKEGLQNAIMYLETPKPLAIQNNGFFKI